MKQLKSILLCATIALTGLLASAQVRMFEIYKKDGSTLAVPVENIDSLKFSLHYIPTKVLTDTIYEFNGIINRYDPIGDIAPGWTTESVKAPYNNCWVGDLYAKSDEKYLLGSVYSGEIDTEYECWLFSPALNVKDATTKLASFYTAYAYWKESSSLEVYVLNEPQSKAPQKERLNVLLASNPTDRDHDWIASGDIDLSPYGDLVYLGFRYRGIGANCTEFRIDDFAFGRKQIALGETEEVPAPAEITGEGTKEKPYTADDVILLDNAQKGPFYVKGYIIGQVNGTTLSESTVEMTAPFSATNSTGTQASNLLLAAHIDETDITKMVPVQLPSGDLRDALNLYQNEGMHKKEILLYGNLEKYYNVPSVKSPSYAVVEGTEYGVKPVDVSNAILNETFLGSFGSFTTYNVSGEQEWVADATYGAKMTGYASGNHANEDWLISPAVDLTGKTGVTIVFEHAINKGDVANLKTNHTLLISDNYTSGDPTAATWVEVPITTYPAGNNWNYVSSGEIAIPTAYLKANVTIAFKYLCSDSESATWEIKNFVMK